MKNFFLLILIYSVINICVLFFYPKQLTWRDNRKCYVFYNDDLLVSKSLSLPGNNEHLMLKLGFFKNYKERLDKLGCRETGDCEDFELCKWKYFYYNPEKYYLYQNEPQVLEFLMQTELSGCKFKAKHTSSNGSNYLSNIKYLTLLSLLLLF